MSISLFRFNVLFLLLIGFIFPVSNSFAQTDATEEMQKEELVTRAPREADGPLAWKFKEGLSIKILMDQANNVEMEVGGQPISTKTKAINDMSLVITSVDEEGVATASNTIDRMVVSTETPAMSFEFDSDEEDEGDAISAQIGKMIRPMIGQPITQKMKPDGKVFDVELPDGLREVLKNPQMAMMFSEKSFQDMASKGSLVFPETKLDVGHTWNVSETVEMAMMKVTTSTEYTYRGVADVDGKPLHIIVGKLSMEFPQGNMEITDEDATITLYFDGVAGRTAKTELHQKMTMVVNAGPQEIIQNLTQTMSVTMTVEE